MINFTCMDDKGETVNVHSYTERLAQMEAQKKLTGKIVAVTRNKTPRIKRNVMEA